MLSFEQMNIYEVLVLAGEKRIIRLGGGARVAAGTCPCHWCLTVLIPLPRC